MINLKNNKQVENLKLANKPTPKQKAIDVDALAKESKERSKDQSFFQKLLNFFKKDKRYTELLINGLVSEKRVALLQDGLLENLEIESADNQQMVGAIFKGKIQNLEPGLKAAFVDIGQSKNAFLHYWDILPMLNGEALNESDRDEGIEVVHRNTTNVHKPKVTLQDIPNLFPIGTEIVIQITKSQIGTKGPRTTTNISLAGRYLVLTPYSNQCGISRKIEDPKERERLKKILHKLQLPMGMGIIFRTASAGNSLKQFTRDLQYLLDTWQQIQNKDKKTKEPSLLYQEPGIIERTVRDFLTENIDRVLVDNLADYNLIVEKVKKIAPHVLNKIVHFKEPIPIFDRFNIETQIEQTFASRVPLASGGEIVIQETEALTSIDVNTSSHRSMDNEASHFIFQANIEAAKEVARQIRLRNIGGLIIVDFIDMKQSKDRRLLYQFVQNEFAKDKAKSHVLPISALGIMQITRQRHKESVLSRLYMPCPYCSGEGVLKSQHNMAMRIQREILRQVFYAEKQGKNNRNFQIVLHPHVLNYIRLQCQNEFNNLEKEFNISLKFTPNSELHLETFKVNG